MERRFSGRRVLSPGAVVLAALFLLHASRGIERGGSYWLDELYSVTAVQQGWGDLLRLGILPDPHPPLYAVLLKPWVDVFGASEVATRLLSLLFAALTLAVFAAEVRRSGSARRLLALGLFGVSPAFANYAQETRSYSLLLALASLVTVTQLRLRAASRPDAAEDAPTRRRLAALQYPASLLLSLTHYFGWPYVALLAALVLLGFGSVGTLRRFLSAPGRRLPPAQDESRFLLLLIALFLTVVGLIDRHTPISFPRYYLVLLPATALLTGNALVGLASSPEPRSLRPWAALLLGGLWFGLLGTQSYAELSRRLQVPQNWKGLAAYVRASGLCTDRCFVIGGYGLHRHYFGSSPAYVPLPDPRRPGGRAALASRLAAEPEVPVLGFHGAPGEGAGSDRPGGAAGLADPPRQAGGRICLEPPQAWQGSTFLLLPPQRRSGLEERHGLRPCGSPPSP